ncbi:hypothetical protein TNCV_369581 [Trichonephila clavipes]|nr:hypothetical protein TNCV_369581 [Trichonephila clavipes]
MIADQLKIKHTLYFGMRITWGIRWVRPQYSTHNKIHGFWFTTMLTLTPPISPDSSCQKKWAVQIEHPPYSPDFNPDFFLFPRIKLALKGKGFDELNVTRLLNPIPNEDFS